MKSIEELALKVAHMGMLGDKDATAFTKERIIDFAKEFLAAYTEQQEQVAWQYLLMLDGEIINEICSKVHWDERYQPFGRKGVDYNASASAVKLPLYTAPVVPDGMVLVPRELKGDEGDDMREAGHQAVVAQGKYTNGAIDAMWQAMLYVAGEKKS